MLEFPILYLKVMRILMFQLSGFYCKGSKSYEDQDVREGCWLEDLQLK